MCAIVIRYKVYYIIFTDIVKRIVHRTWINLNGYFVKLYMRLSKPKVINSNNQLKICDRNAILECKMEINTYIMIYSSY